MLAVRVSSVPPVAALPSARSGQGRHSMNGIRIRHGSPSIDRSDGYAAGTMRVEALSQVPCSQARHRRRRRAERPEACRARDSRQPPPLPRAPITPPETSFSTRHRPQATSTSVADTTKPVPSPGIDQPPVVQEAPPFCNAMSQVSVGAFRSPIVTAVPPVAIVAPRFSTAEKRTNRGPDRGTPPGTANDGSCEGAKTCPHRGTTQHPTRTIGGAGRQADDQQH